MATYKVPIFFEPFVKQKRAARLLHLLAGFLMIANAWGDFKQPTPNLFFVVVQIAAALVTLLYAFAGKKIFGLSSIMNGLFRLAEAAVLFYAAWYFNNMNLTMMSWLQVIGGAGLLLLFITERKIFTPCFVRIDEKGIYLPNNFGEKLIEWKDIDNMLIKNDFISINTVQNQFIQYETGVVLSELQMDEMNAYCREKFVK
ncbi:MAG: hypothetical protein QM725_06395 [Lacibacter sp.]